MIDQVLSERTTADWLTCLQGVAPVAPVLDVAGALDNPFVRDGDRIAKFESRTGPPVTMLTGPVKIADQSQDRRVGPALGADTDAILRRCGYDECEIAKLRQNRII